MRAGPTRLLLMHIQNIPQWKRSEQHQTRFDTTALNTVSHEVRGSEMISICRDEAQGKTLSHLRCVLIAGGLGLTLFSLLG